MISPYVIKIYTENSKLFITLDYELDWISHLNCSGKGGWVDEVRITNPETIIEVNDFIAVFKDGKLSTKGIIPISQKVEISDKIVITSTTPPKLRYTSFYVSKTGK